MGLDSVELVMNVEKHFGIRIPDKEAEKILTVQDFTDCVSSYITLDSGAKCKSQYLFYVLRDYFVTEYQHDKLNFLPTTLIDEIMPVESRKDIWEKLSTDFNIELPTLRKIDTHPGEEESLFSELFIDKRNPVGDYSIRDLVNWILSLNHRKLITVDNLFNTEDVKRIIVGIISDRMAIDVESIEPHHKIVDDLGIN